MILLIGFALLFRMLLILAGIACILIAIINHLPEGLVVGLAFLSVAWLIKAIVRASQQHLQ